MVRESTPMIENIGEAQSLPWVKNSICMDKMQHVDKQCYLRQPSKE